MSNRVHVIGHVAYVALYGVLILSTIIFYNPTNQILLLYLGWSALILGIIFLLLSSQSRKGSCDEFVESGMYAIVRHPEFLGHMLIISALVVISQHWISLIVSTTLIILLFFAIIEEEKRNVEKFGDAYRDYMKRVPRINLLIGIIKICKKKR